MTLLASEPTIYEHGEDLRERFETAAGRERALATILDIEDVLPPWDGVVICVEPPPLDVVELPEPVTNILKIDTTTSVSSSCMNERIVNVVAMNRHRRTHKGSVIGETALGTLVEFFAPRLAISTFRTNH
jgi:hypothetical protein